MNEQPASLSPLSFPCHSTRVRRPRASVHALDGVGRKGGREREGEGREESGLGRTIKSTVLLIGREGASEGGRGTAALLFGDDGRKEGSEASDYERCPCQQTQLSPSVARSTDRSVGRAIIGLFVKTSSDDSRHFRSLMSRPRRRRSRTITRNAAYYVLIN